MSTLIDWKKAQSWEASWHHNCANSYNEETKQYIYAHRMGLDEFREQDVASRIYWNYGLNSVIDIGGGPYSLLLKSIAPRMVVVDPCEYPKWVRQRYAECSIDFRQEKGEDVERIFRNENKFDIALIYNCLQHVIDPEAIIRSTRLIAREIRIFEWIETGTNIGHLHNLTAQNLDNWLGGHGKVENIAESGCYGQCYYGIFPC